MTDAHDIAQTLSEAQRRAVLAARTGYSEPPRVYDRGTVRAALRRRGLGHGDFCYLTPLGLAVRAILMAESGGER